MPLYPPAGGGGAFTVYSGVQDPDTPNIAGNGAYQDIVTIADVPPGSYVAIGMAWLDDTNDANDINRFGIGTVSNSAGTIASSLVRTGSNQPSADTGNAGADITPVIIGLLILTETSTVYLTWNGVAATGGVPQIINTANGDADAPSTSLLLLKYA